MSNQEEFAFKVLHECFPVRALYLSQHLNEANKGGKAIEDWREQQLFKFIGLLTQNAEDLEQGYREKKDHEVSVGRTEYLGIVDLD